MPNTSNPNYVRSGDGWERNPEAPDARHKSRLNWQRQQDLEAMREAIRRTREEQNRRNEEYRRRHGS